MIQARLQIQFVFSISGLGFSAAGFFVVFQQTPKVHLYGMRPDLMLSTTSIINTAAVAAAAATTTTTYYF